MSDEEMMDDDFEGEELEEDIDDIDPDDLEEEIEDLEGDLEGDDSEVADEDASKPMQRPGADDDDEDEDLTTADDVEADLDAILKDRMVAAEEVPAEEEELDDRGDSSDRLQPKRPDETLCSSCFLLVRESAPQCPVGDDSCPLFPS